MKKRVIPSILITTGTSTSLSQKFSPWRTTGTLAQMLRLHINRQADELLIINLTNKSDDKFTIANRIIRLVHNEVDIPIAYCGGISTVEDAKLCINKGFDKVYITELLIENIDIIKAIKDTIGSQSLGVIIPYKLNPINNKRYIWNYRIKGFSNIDLEEAINTCHQLKVGEIILYSVDHDGMLNGLDQSIINIIRNLKIDVPILMAGGASSEEDFVEVLKSPYIQGIVAASIFSLTKSTPVTIRDYCFKNNIEMRRI